MHYPRPKKREAKSGGRGDGDSSRPLGPAPMEKRCEADFRQADFRLSDKGRSGNGGASGPALCHDLEPAEPGKDPENGGGREAKNGRDDVMVENMAHAKEREKDEQTGAEGAEDAAPDVLAGHIRHDGDAFGLGFRENPPPAAAGIDATAKRPENRFVGTGTNPGEG